MIRRTTVNLTEATDKQVQYLQEAGFGSFTEITRIAIDRMYQNERRTDMANTRIFRVGPDGTYDKISEKLEEEGYRWDEENSDHNSQTGHGTDRYWRWKDNRPELAKIEY